MKKKIVAVIAVVTVLGLAGCQNAVSTNEPGTTATGAPTKEAEPTKAAIPEPTKAATPEPTEAATLEPTKAVTPEPTKAATPEPTKETTPEPTKVPTPEPTKAATPEPTKAATPEPTKVPTPEPTKEPEKPADKNGCSDVITAVDYTSDKGVITSYNEDTGTEEVLAYLHKDGLKFYEGGESHSAIFGSSLYGKYFDSDDGNHCKYAISYRSGYKDTTAYSLEDMCKYIEYLREDWLDRMEEQFGEIASIYSSGIYEFNGTKIAYSREQYKEGAWGQDGYEYTPAYISYSFYQDIGLGEYIAIEVTSYDVTEDMDTVLGRVLLLEGDYTINQ